MGNRARKQYNERRGRYPHARFGHPRPVEELRLADRCELKLPVGGRHALIGPNGAGKTTLFNLVTGMLAPNAGQILLSGEDVTALEPQERVAELQKDLATLDRLVGLRVSAAKAPAVARGTRADRSREKVLYRLK